MDERRKLVWKTEQARVEKALGKLTSQRRSAIVWGCA